MSISPIITPIGSQFLAANCTGLGNAMFQTAAVYGISKKANLKPNYTKVIDYCNLLKERFGYDHGQTIFRNVQNPFSSSKQTNSIHEPSNQSLVEVLFQINPSANNILDGYYEAVSYFQEYKTEIQTLFSPDLESLNTLQTRFPFLFDDTVTVGVHFRLNHTHRFLSNDAYRKCVEIMKKTLGENIVFIVFTDDIDSTNLDIFKDCKYKVINTQIDYFDMWALSMCKNYILSLSTFAFWGYYLNSRFDGKILVPPFEKDWYDNIAKNTIEGFKTNI